MAIYQDFPKDLPSATLSDATPNPNTPTTGAGNMGYNGTTWDRLRAGLVNVQTTFVGLLNTIGLARYSATPPTLANGNVAPIQSDVRGRAVTRNRTTATTVNSVASTITSGVVLSANPARGGAKLVNLSTALFYGLYGTGVASPTNCSFVLAPLTGGIPGIEEVPFGYEGEIAGVWSAASGSLVVTEFI